MQTKVEVVPASVFDTQEPLESVYPVGQVCVCVIEIEPLELPPDIFMLELEPDRVKEPFTVSEQVFPDKVYPLGQVKYAPDGQEPLVGVEPSEQTADSVNVCVKDKGIEPVKLLAELS